MKLLRIAILILSAAVCARGQTVVSLASAPPAAGMAAFWVTPTSANLRATVTDPTGTGSLVFGTAPTITLANGTGLPISTGVSGLGAGIATFLGTPSGANLGSALTTALPVTAGGTGLSTTTSGGLLYSSGTAVIASSAALTSNAFLTGGGAGAAPNAVAITGLVKGNGASAPAAASSATDYLAPSGSTAHTVATSSASLTAFVATSTANSGYIQGSYTMDSAGTPLILNFASVIGTGGIIGTGSAHNLLLRTNNTARVTIADPSGDTTFASTTEATTGGAGSIKTSGGIYAAKKIVSTTDGIFGGTLAVTGHTTLEGVTSTGATGTGKIVYDTSPQVRLAARITTITSSATPTVNTDNCDCVTITALAAAITSMTTNLSGTPVNFDQLEYRIVDNATARAITWGASFVAGPAALPTTTIISKALHVYFEYDSVQAKWVCISTGSDA